MAGTGLTALLAAGGTLEDITPGVTYRGDDIGRWLTRQVRDWAQLNPEQQHRLGSLGVRPAARPQKTAPEPGGEALQAVGSGRGGNGRGSLGQPGAVPALGKIRLKTDPSSPRPEREWSWSVAGQPAVVRTETGRAPVLRCSTGHHSPCPMTGQIPADKQAAGQPGDERATRSRLTAGAPCPALGQQRPGPSWRQPLSSRNGASTPGATAPTTGRRATPASRTTDRPW
ncbi:hypothetical protein ABID95_004241 [Streptomyces atratus]